MFLDVLSGNANILMNIKLARITNITTAVYFSELTNILIEVRRKNKCDSNGFFKLNRKYVEERTTLSVEEQLECDTILAKLGVFAADAEDPDRIMISPERMTNLLINDNLEGIASVKSKLKVNRTETAAKKKAGTILNMKNICAELEPNEEIRTALYAWVDAVYACKSRGFLRKDIITNFVTEIRQFSMEPAVQLKIIAIASANGWSCAEWAINSYKRSIGCSGRANANSLQTVQQTATELDKSAAF